MAEIGYTLAPEHHGHGYATEAVRALIDFAYERLDLHSVRAVTDARNTASIRVAERLGMRRVATLHTTFKNERCVECTYGSTRE